MNIMPHFDKVADQLENLEDMSFFQSQEKGKQPITSSTTSSTVPLIFSSKNTRQLVQLLFLCQYFGSNSESAKEKRIQRLKTI